MRRSDVEDDNTERKTKPRARRVAPVASVAMFGIALAMGLSGGCGAGSTDSTEGEDETAGVAGAPENVTTAEQDLFINGDFETGTAGVAPPSWTLNTYLNNGVTLQTPQTRAGLNLAGGGIAETQMIVSPGGAGLLTDASVGAGATLRVPKYGNKCAFINMNPGSSNNANGIKQTMVLGVNDVSPTDGKVHVRFAVAPVMENPGHAAS